MYRKVTEHFCLLLKVKNPPSFVGLTFPKETVGQQNLFIGVLLRAEFKPEEAAATSHSGLKVKSSNFANADS